MNKHELTEGIKFVFLALIIGVCLALIFETCNLKPAFASEPDTPNTGQTPPRGAVAYLLDKDHTPLKDPRWTDAERFEAALYGAAVDNGLDPALFIAMAYKESSFDVSARGRLGEFGLVQVHGKAKRGATSGHPRGRPSAARSGFLVWFRNVGGQWCSTRRNAVQQALEAHAVAV